MESKSKVSNASGDDSAKVQRFLLMAPQESRIMVYRCKEATAPKIEKGDVVFVVGHGLSKHTFSDVSVADLGA